MQLEFFPSYANNGMLDKAEAVPFRLTRNLATFFSPFGVEGPFLSAMTAASQVTYVFRKRWDSSL